jgi:hypothetical protein
MGIVTGHLYTLLDAVAIQKDAILGADILAEDPLTCENLVSRLVKIMNPHGSGGWKGTFSN